MSVPRAVPTWALFCMAATLGHAQTPNGEGSPWNVESGFDLRLRQEVFNDIPIAADPPGVSRGGKNDYFRIRTRLWTRLDYRENISVVGRLANEFRHYNTPDSDAYDFPDEAVVDLLYLDIRALAGGRLDLRIGRQELIYGAGRVLLEGTPKDGSRTIYFDAVKAAVKLSEQTSVDLLGIYNQSDAHLLIDDQDRDITGYDSGYNDNVESGLGAYLRTRAMENAPAEVYYLWKKESRWFDAAGERIPGRDLHTLGMRLLPRISESLSAEVEAAVQAGEIDDGRDCEGYMGYAGLSWAFTDAETDGGYTPYTKIAYYTLSGDDPDSGRDEGWNPLWARYPQFSELYIYAFDAERAGEWNNISYPHLEIGLRKNRMCGLAIQAGPLMALENTGPGAGHDRGAFASARWDFPLSSGLAGKIFGLGETRDRLFGHLLAEVLDPGDYYRVDATAYFLRWEVTYLF